MKKLMIAAAVAAMIGGAEAAYEYVYDFTASVKSTGSKSTKDNTYTVNCGYKDSGVYWWQAASDAGLIDADNSQDAKAEVDGMTNDEKRDLAEFLGFMDNNYKKTNYNKKDKTGWCHKFTFTEYGVCYRVAKSYKLKDKFVSDCCSETWASWAKADSEIGPSDSDLDFSNGFLYKFNAANYGSANKAEIFGELAAPTAFNKAFGVVDTNFVSDVVAVLAGQGSWKLNKDFEDEDDYEYYVDGISGNIVGSWAGPVCGCCGDFTPAVAFVCDEDEDVAIADIIDAMEDRYTALFGTFTLKVNKMDTIVANAAE